MRSVNFFFMTAGLAQCIAAAPAEAGADQLNIRTDTDDVPDYSADSDWDFATLDEAYDPEDPAIKDLPEIDPSEIVFTDYDAEMNGTSPNPIARGLVGCSSGNYSVRAWLTYSDPALLRHDQLPSPHSRSHPRWAQLPAQRR